MQNSNRSDVYKKDKQTNTTKTQHQSKNRQCIKHFAAACGRACQKDSDVKKTTESKTCRNQYYKDTKDLISLGTQIVQPIRTKGTYSLYFPSDAICLCSTWTEGDHNVLTMTSRQSDLRWQPVRSKGTSCDFCLVLFIFILLWQKETTGYSQ